MLQSKDNSKESFICPQCHQDMSTMEMLQIHLQNVHSKQSSTIVKGLFSFAKEKIKSVQDNFKTSSEPLKIYAPYFSSNSNGSNSKQQSIGYMRSYSDYFKSIRKNKLDQIFTITRQTLLRIELLTTTNEYIPRNGNTKERLKYEQGIVTWMEDSVTSICASCSKSFGLFGRKHHCRLDGYVICNQCSRFLSFSIAQWIIELNTSFSSTIDESTRQRLTSLINITSSIINNDGSNEDYLRICLSCEKFLQKNYDKIRLKIIEKDQVFHHYEKIVQAQIECHHIHPTYSIIIDSLLSGDTKYQITDAQHIYQQLNTNYDKIDSTSRLISKLADSCHENDRRYTALCRNIRVYAIQILQNYSVSTKRVPSKDDIKRARDECIGKLALNLSRKVEPSVPRYSQVIQFIQQDKLTGRNDEVIFFESNLKDLEQGINISK